MSGIRSNTYAFTINIHNIPIIDTQLLTPLAGEKTEPPKIYVTYSMIICWQKAEPGFEFKPFDSYLTSILHCLSW